MIKKHNPDGTILYQEGFWWEVGKHLGEYIVYSATSLSGPKYGPFKSLELACWWVENIFLQEEGDNCRTYPRT